MSLTQCLKKAGDALRPEDKAAILAAAAKYRKAGLTADEAGRKAVDDQLAAVQAMLEAPAEVAAPEPAPAAPAVVEDFGEKLPPARRAMAAKLDEDLSDDDIAKRPLSEIWPLAENDAIEDTFAAAVAHAARAEVPAKPRQPYKLRQWVAKVKTVRELAGKIVSGRVTRERMIELVNTQQRSLKDWLSKVLLLEQVPRDQWKRIGSVEERPESFTYEDGKQVPTPILRLEIDGKGQWLRGDAGIQGEERGTVAGNKAAIMALLAAAEPDKRMEFEIRGPNGGPYKVNKKGDPEYRPLMKFATPEEARRAINVDYDSLVAAWEAVKARDNITERDLRSAENRPRVGKDHRGGKDITPQEFQDTFGFRGGEFGKWVQQGKGDKERQALLNSAYDALMDLSDIVGVPPKAISLNGTLGIAFGSRGSGWASAHFEPSNLVINLTKTRGAGSLAHEWLHALDNYFGRMRRGGEEAKFTGDKKKYDAENFITHKPEPLMVKKDGRGQSMTKARLEQLHKAYPTVAVYDSGNWMVDPKHPDGVRPEVEKRFADLVAELNASPMAKRAQTLDKGKSDGYWSSTLEMAARAFESFVMARMHESGYHNDFLVNVRKAEEVAKDPARYPYLMAGEIKPIADAFEALFATVKTREDDAGNVAMFSRASTGRGIPMTDARAVAGNIRAALPKAPQIILHESVDQAPESLLEVIREAGAENDVEAAYHEGEIHVFPGHIESIERMEFVVGRHEIRHYGIRAMLGPRYGQTLLAMVQKNPALRNAARKKIDDGLASSMVEAADEALADMPIEEIAKLNGFDRFVAAIRQWLRDMAAKLRKASMPRLADAIDPKEWTDRDVAAFVLKAEDMSRKGSPEPMSTGGTMFGRSYKQLPAATDITRYKNLKWDQASDDMQTAELGNGWVASIYQNEDGTAELTVLLPNGADFGEPKTYAHIGEARLAAPAVLARMVIEDGTQPGDSVAHILAGAPDDGGTRFSRATGLNMSRAAITKATRTTLHDMLSDAGKKVTWWDKSVGTQYAKARKFRGYGIVFDKVQEYIEDTSTLANQAADMAPDLLPKLETWGDFKKMGLSAKDAEAIAAPIFEGTLTDTRFDEAELRGRFGLNDRQVNAYGEFFDAVNESLDQVMAAEVIRLLGDKSDALRSLALEDRAALRQGVEQFLDEQVEQNPGDEQLTKLRDDIAEKYERIDKLKAEGYAPLMRFGKYKVHIFDPQTDQTKFFGLYESAAEANRAARELMEDPAMQGNQVEQGVLSQKQYEMFAAMPMDSLEMFAEAMGADESDVFKEYIRLAKNNRSALKRLLKRKGTAGYSTDARRVLAAFVTSNARLAAGALNLPGAKQAALDIRDGDVQDEAIGLIQSIQAPKAGAAWARALMFTNFIGGSIASALVNVTQPITMTLPWLSQWGGIGKAGKRLMEAGRMAASGKGMSADLAAALKKAEDDGIVSPQEIHYLQSQAMGKLGSNPVLQRVAFVWAAPFTMAEQFNRRTSFIAAYLTAKQEGFGEAAFDFAQRAVVETQGLYNPGNQANWARNPVGAAVLTFKQFSVHYLEWTKRMWTAGNPGSPERKAGRRAVLYAMAILMVAAGTDGLPFADDLDDLIDTIGQALGYDWNSKRARREFVADTLGMGDQGADVVARGFSAMAGIPFDVSLRMSMGNLLPGSGMLLRSNVDKSREVLELAGPAGGLIDQYTKAGEKALQGDAAGAALQAMPVAIQNVGKALGMWSTGEARDTKGRRIMEADEIDGLMRFLGFNPQSIARESEKMGMLRRSEQLAKNIEGEIAADWARALADKDRDAVEDAKQRLKDWNEKNPDQPIRITGAQILKRVQKLRQDRRERFITATSPERRRATAEALQ